MTEAEDTPNTQPARRHSRRPHPDDPSFWTATEAITFLAFEKPDPLSVLIPRDEALGSLWQEMPWFSMSEPTHLKVIQALAEIGPADIKEQTFTKRQLAVAEHIKTKLSQTTGRAVLYPELALLFRKAWEDHKLRASAMEEMITALLDAVARGKIEMLGVSDRDLTRSHVPVPRRALARPWTIRNDGMHLKQGVSIKQMRATVGVETYCDLQFDPADVRWLKRDLSRASVARATTRPNRKSIIPEVLAPQLEDICAKHIALNGKPMPRKEAEDTVQKSSGCNRRSARAAFNRLPEHLRSPRGRPSENTP